MRYGNREYVIKFIFEQLPKSSDKLIIENNNITNFIFYYSETEIKNKIKRLHLVDSIEKVTEGYEFDKKDIKKILPSIKKYLKTLTSISFTTEIEEYYDREIDTIKYDGIDFVKSSTDLYSFDDLIAEPGLDQPYCECCGIINKKMKYVTIMGMADNYASIMCIICFKEVVSKYISQVDDLDKDLLNSLKTIKLARKLLKET
jgi:hypothetical protein